MDFSHYIIDDKFTVLMAMQRLDIIDHKILFLVDNNKLVGALTDGDVRRWILKSGDLNLSVSFMANKSPLYLSHNKISYSKKFMNENDIDALPILDSNHSIISIIFKNDHNTVSKFTDDVKVVIMAGGLGTRLYPYTKILPKPLIPIGEVPITEHIMDRFSLFGIKNFILIVNHKKSMIKSYFNDIDKNYKIEYADENKPLGTGGGLSLIKKKIQNTFILSNCDILIEEDYKKIYDYHRDNNFIITIVCSLKNFKIPYGVIQLDESGNIQSMIEKPNMTYLTNTGMYVVDKKVIDDIDYDTEISFPDIISKYKESGYKIGVFPISEESWLDMGQLEDLEKMRIKLYEK
jgi:dTDP-glucose pyrophosphorylase